MTPRQKMVSLMYLVFIAMLALNMSKEVLTAFGNFNDKFEESNKLTEASNASLAATAGLVSPNTINLNVAILINTFRLVFHLHLNN